MSTVPSGAGFGAGAGADSSGSAAVGSPTDLASLSRESLVLRAKLAQGSELFDDLLEAMRAVIKLSPVLTAEERLLYATAYKFVLQVPRNAFREMTATVEDAEISLSEHGEEQRAAAECFAEDLGLRVQSLCHQAISELTSSLLPNAEDKRAVAFYNKMIGDQYRFLAEVTYDADQLRHVELSRTMYAKALAEAKGFPPTDPLLLSISLNYSVLLREVAPDEEAVTLAVQVARAAFDAAMSKLDTLEPQEYENTVSIMHMIRDNLTLWAKSETEDEASVDDDSDTDSTDDAGGDDVSATL